MEYLQYLKTLKTILAEHEYKSFKPCYKWNTFNTEETPAEETDTADVLNLVINGIPSIL